VADASGAPVYWHATSYKYDGNVTGESWANGVTSTRGYSDATGRMSSISTGTSTAAASIQNLSYVYYKSGNLQAQTKALGTSVTETFGYDVLDRCVP